MFYTIAKHLAAHWSVFNVFSYLTLRSILAAMSALAIALIAGPFMIARLSRYKIGQVVRAAHLAVPAEGRLDVVDLEPDLVASFPAAATETRDRFW